MSNKYTATSSRGQASATKDTDDDDSDDDCSWLNDLIPLKAMQEMLGKNLENEPNSTTSTGKTHVKARLPNEKKKKNKKKDSSNNNTKEKNKNVGVHDNGSGDNQYTSFDTADDVRNKTNAGDAGRSEVWTGFWTAASKAERKKRRKPLTVVESKRRRGVKARRELIKQMNDYTRPMCHLFDNPDLYL